MDYHHVIEAAGVVSLGLVAYSYLVRWFEAGPPARRRWRPVATGLTFGAVAIVLMISRIHVGEDRFVDARVIPIALVALVEGGPAGALAAAVAAGYRIWLGGSGAVAGVIGIAATAAAAGAVRVWARRDGGVGLRHSFALSLAVWLITAASFLMTSGNRARSPDPYPRAFRKRRVASAGESAARMNEIAATPRAPASLTSLTRSGVMPPIAMTGMRSPRATSASRSRPWGGPYGRLLGVA